MKGGIVACWNVFLKVGWPFRKQTKPSANNLRFID